MKNYFKIFAPSISATILFSCAHQVRLETQPAGAQIFRAETNGSRGTQLGQTPINLSSIDGSAIYITKPGYIDSVILLPDKDTPQYADYKIALQQQTEKHIEASIFETQPQYLNNTISEFLTFQSYINDPRKNSDAERFIEKNKVKYGRLSMFHVMVGHFYYFKKQPNEARASYNRALELEPGNDEAQQMLKLIQNQKR